MTTNTIQLKHHSLRSMNSRGSYALYRKDNTIKQYNNKGGNAGEKQLLNFWWVAHLKILETLHLKPDSKNNSNINNK